MKSYSQHFIILKEPVKPGEEVQNIHKIWMKVGEYCYTTTMKFPTSLLCNLEDVPMLIPYIQEEGNQSMKYMCTSTSIPKSSEFYKPIEFLYQGLDFFINEISNHNSDAMKTLNKWKTVYDWIDKKQSDCYFELVADKILNINNDNNNNDDVNNEEEKKDFMNIVDIMIKKVYIQGLIIVVIWKSGVFYFTINNGEGDQALIDVRYPDLSKHGQGLFLANYYLYDNIPFSRLSVWHIIDPLLIKQKEVPPAKTYSITSCDYEQTYAILKGNDTTDSPIETITRDAIFRWGNWCYAGQVTLKPAGEINISNAPEVIEALRHQQSKLRHIGSVNYFPATNRFSKVLKYMNRIAPLVEQRLEEVGIIIENMLNRIKNSGIISNISDWVGGDPSQSFFEFEMAPFGTSTKDDTTNLVLEDGFGQATKGYSNLFDEAFDGMELVAQKIYHASGVVTMMMAIGRSIYVSLAEQDTDCPLLDSYFPCIHNKGQGFACAVYGPVRLEQKNGERDTFRAADVSNIRREISDDWPELRRIILWQTTTGMEESLARRTLTSNSLVEGGTAEAIAQTVNTQQSIQLFAEDATRSFISYTADGKHDLNGANLNNQRNNDEKNNNDGNKLDSFASFIRQKTSNNTHEVNINDSQSEEKEDISDNSSNDNNKNNENTAKSIRSDSKDFYSRMSSRSSINSTRTTNDSVDTLSHPEDISITTTSTRRQGGIMQESTLDNLHELRAKEYTQTELELARAIGVNTHGILGKHQVKASSLGISPSSQEDSVALSRSHKSKSKHNQYK